MYKTVSSSERAIKPKEHTVKIIAIFMLVILTLIQQMPIVKDVYYDRLRVLLYLGFGIFSFYSLFSLPRFIKHSFVKYYLLCIVYYIMLIAGMKIARVKLSLASIFELLVPFGILLCSLNVPFSRKQQEKLLKTYVFLSAILGLSSIFYYGEGFTILERYFLAGKNQIGPLLGNATVIAIYRLFKTNTKTNENRKKSSIIATILLSIIIISSIVVIRNRSGLVAIIIVTFLLIRREFKIELNLKNIIIIHFSLLALLILLITGYVRKAFQVIQDVFVSNYDITDLNSISAGRVIVYKSAIAYILKNPIIGELDTMDKFYGIPHNYILNKWVRYGIIGSLPIVTFYCFIWYFVLAELRKSRQKSGKSTLALWVLLFSLIVSIFEYSYPFGPGTSQMMVWLLLGQYLKEELTNEQKDKVSSQKGFTDITR